MPVTVHYPSAPLDQYIKCLWFAEKPFQYERLKMLPVPSLHLMVNLGSPFHVYKAGQTQPFAACATSWSVGLWNQYHTMDMLCNAQVLNVSFKPGGANLFLRLPLSELHNQIVPLDAIWGSQAGEIREQLYAAATTPARFALMERLLLARLCEKPYGFETVQYAVAEMDRLNGAVSIQALCDLIGISQKHLIVQFKRIVGTTPKELARLYRFKHVLVKIDPTQPIDWTAIARRSYYHDLSHLAKDFQAFTGHTPNEYLQLRARVHVDNPANNRNPSNLPVG